jgi:hypothetical protein
MRINRKMNGKSFSRSTFLFLEALLMIAGMSMSQACFFNSGPGYGHGPVVAGDYDEGHVWRSRDWWTSNRADWAHAHHPEWYN